MIRPIALALLLFAAPADPIPAEKARDHVGKDGTFAMTVRASRDVVDSEVYFLNSERDYRDPKTLTIVIEYEDADAFKRAGIANPATYYRGKSIRVNGTVIEDRGQTRIRVTSPEQIKEARARADR